MNRIAYIAGKIAGLPAAQVANKFNAMATHLLNKGYSVIKPTALYEHEPATDTATRSDIQLMLGCDEVHLLHDWQQSRGASLKRDIAIRMGMEVVYH